MQLNQQINFKHWYKRWYTITLAIIVFTFIFPPAPFFVLILLMWWKIEKKGNLIVLMKVCFTVILLFFGFTFASVWYSEDTSPRQIQPSKVTHNTKPNNQTVQDIKEVNADETIEENNGTQEINQQKELAEISPEQQLRILVNEEYSEEPRMIEVLPGVTAEIKQEVVELVFADPSNKAWVIYHYWSKDKLNPAGKWSYYMESEWEWKDGKWQSGKSNLTSYHGSKPNDELEFQVHDMYGTLTDSHTEEVFNNNSLPSGEELNAAEKRALNETAKKYNISTRDVLKFFTHVEKWTMFSDEGQKWFEVVGSIKENEEKRARSVSVSNVTVRNEFGVVSVLGEITNNTNKTAGVVYITVTFYDQNGRIVDTAVDSQANLSPKQTTTFDARGIYRQGFKTYKIDIDALYL